MGRVIRWLFAHDGPLQISIMNDGTLLVDIQTTSDGHDKPFRTKAIMIIDNFKKALGDTDNRQISIS